MLANCAIHDASSAGNLQAAILGSPSRCVFVSTAIVTREPFSSYAGSSMPEANAKLLSESAEPCQLGQTVFANWPSGQVGPMRASLGAARITRSEGWRRLW